MPAAPHEDFTEQQERVAQARADLADLLTILATEAKKAASAARAKRGNPNLLRVYGATEDVRRAETAVDIALADLRTASGDDL